MTPEEFFALTGYQFEQEELLEQALTHRSYSQSSNNERLEFLGDSILNLSISIHIYAHYPEASEGELTRIRAALVRQATLAQIARGIGLGEHIRLGSGDLKSGSHRRASILSDAMEALIGAVYLDSDFSHAQRVVLALYQQTLLDLGDVETLKDAKTRLQEYLQGRKMTLPDYLVETATGKSHEQIFTVSCKLAGLDIETRGRGASRKKAEQQAAQKMLEALKL